jgi:protein tyrosine/serine phosphatase
MADCRKNGSKPAGPARARLALSAGILLALALAGLLAWNYLVQKNFDIVVPGKIYRSGQPSPAQLTEWIRKYNLKTILVLKPTLRPYEKELAGKLGVNLHHIVVSTKQGLPENQWQQIKQILTEEENLPLLLHCHSGADKTGTVTALYRVEVQGWPLWKALLEMDLHGHIPLQYPALQRYLKDRFKTGFDKKAAESLH